MVERETRTLKDPSVCCHRFETLQHARSVIADWSASYNHRPPRQAQGMKTVAEAYALAARPVQKPLRQYNLQVMRSSG